VRDSLLHKTPHDWDITTAAKPEKIIELFSDIPVLETGLKHGTVTLLTDHEPYEVTTFRVDGDYTDGRHPDSVAFTTDIRDDLARRDLTINAMAYSPATGIIDPFGGQEDLKNEIISLRGRPAQALFGRCAAPDAHDSFRGCTRIYGRARNAARRARPA